MPPDFGPMLATLRRDDIRFVVIGPVAAQARGATLPEQLVDQLTLDLVPDTHKANLARLALTLSDKCAPALRVGTASDGLPIILDAVTFARLPILPLTTKLGDLNIVLNPPGGLRGYAALARETSQIEVDGTPVSVATIDALLLGLAGGAQLAHAELLAELRRVQDEATRATATDENDAMLKELSAEALTLEMAVQSALSRQQAPVTIREISSALRGRTPASYQEIRHVADELTKRGRLLRRKTGTAYTYQVNDDYDAQAARQIASLLAATADPSSTVQHALTLLPERPTTVPAVATPPSPAAHHSRNSVNPRSSARNDPRVVAPKIATGRT